MIRLVVLEDEKAASNALLDCIKRYSEESKQLFDVVTYDNALDFIDKYKVSADVIFMDIQMPYLNGMDAAKRVREMDENVVIVFVTNLARYAIEAYEVNAYDFVLKPVRYSAFAMKMDRICRYVERNRSDAKLLTVITREVKKRVLVSDIKYVEVRNHEVILHCADEDVKFRGTLSSVAEELRESEFALCNSCYLVNLKYVTEIDGDTVTVGGEKLRISQPKRKQFVREVAKYIGGSD